MLSPQPAARGHFYVRHGSFGFLLDCNGFARHCPVAIGAPLDIHVPARFLLFILYPLLVRSLSLL
jgi:hypothetical protein